MLRISDKRFVNETLMADVRDGYDDLNQPTLSVYFVGDDVSTKFAGGERQAILAYWECNCSDWRHAACEEE